MADPGWGRSRSLSCTRLLADAICFRDGGEDVVVVCGRHHKAQQLGCQVILALCQGQLRQQQKLLNAWPEPGSGSTQCSLPIMLTLALTDRSSSSL